MKRRFFIFRWIRIAFCALVSAMAMVLTVAWLMPHPASLVNHSLVLADEGHRYNVYAEWDGHYYKLRALPKGVYVVPHRFVVYLLMVLNDERVDTLGVEYRQLTTKPVTPRHIPLFRNIWVQRFSFAADAQTQAQDGWKVSIPIWLAVMMLWAYPAIALARGPVRRWRRRRRGWCENCSYDLSGLTERRCPECGTGF